jgi:hypothetical protein
MSPKASAKPPWPAPAPPPIDCIDAGVAVRVVGRALLAVGEHLVGFLHLLEFRLGVLVVRIAVRVVLHRELPVRLLDLVVGGVPVHAENFVVVPLSHRFGSQPLTS